MYWFRIGSLHVTTTVFVTLVAAVGMIAGTVSSGLLQAAVLTPEVFVGEVWRIITWPWIDRLSFWGIISLLLFWYFGKMLEDDLGRAKMVSFLTGLWAILTASHLVAGLLLPGATVLVGLGMIETLLILLFIMEQPKRPFFFGIPAWVIGAVLVGLQITALAASGNVGGLVGLLLSLAGTVIWARRHGLLSGLPGLRPAKPRSAHTRPPKARRSPQKSKPKKRQLSDDERLNQLLDKINASGMESLTARERDELHQISERRSRR